jgi:site-specific DNA recombinase
LERLQETMADRGLTSRPTRNSPGGPVTLAKLQQMLRDPYYKGVIEYEGAEYPGRHPALISPELFDKVQEILDLRGGRGVRNRKHDHYLKGLLFCERCHKAGRESRLIYTIARGRNGSQWAYYLCRGRQDGLCDLPYLAVDPLEEAVMRQYGRLDLGDNFIATIQDQLEHVVRDQHKLTAEFQASLTLKLAKLERAEERLIDLVADGNLSSARARTKLTHLNQERERLRDQVSEADAELAVGIELVQLALAMLSSPQEVYRQAPDGGRRQLNQAFYQRMYVDDLGEVAEALLTDFFRDFHEGSQRPATARPRKDPLKGISLDEWVATASTADLLADVASAGGSSKRSMVGLAGIEPATSALSVLRSNRLSYSPAFPASDLVIHRVATAGWSCTPLQRHTSVARGPDPASRRQGDPQPRPPAPRAPGAAPSRTPVLAAPSAAPGLARGGFSTGPVRSRTGSPNGLNSFSSRAVTGE